MHLNANICTAASNVHVSTLRKSFAAHGSAVSGMALHPHKAIVATVRYARSLTHRRTNRPSDKGGRKE